MTCPYLVHNHETPYQKGMELQGQLVTKKNTQTKRLPKFHRNLSGDHEVIVWGSHVEKRHVSDLPFPMMLFMGSKVPKQIPELNGDLYTV